MTIRRKVAAALLVTLAVLVGVLYWVLGSLLGAGFGAVETRDARRNVERLREAVQNETAALCQKTSDWASWDDAYRYAQDGNAEFVRANLGTATLEGMNIDFMLIFGASRGLLTDTQVAPDDSNATEVPTRLLEMHFAADAVLVAHETPESLHSGFILTPGQPPALVCSMPILTTEGKGPVRGAMIFGRYAGQAFQEQLARITQLEIALEAEGEASFGPDFQAALPRLAASPVDIETVSEERLTGWTTFPAIDGPQSLVARISMPREVHAQARRTLGYVLAALVVAGLGFAVVILVLLDRLVLGRIARLGAEVRHITDGFDFSARVDDQGSDEVARLGAAMNGMLAAVEQVIFVAGVGVEGR